MRYFNGWDYPIYHTTIKYPHTTWLTKEHKLCLSRKIWSFNFLYIPQETNVSNLNVSSPSPPAVGNPFSVPPSNIFWTNAKNNVNKHAPRLAIGASTCYWSVYGTPNRPNSYISCPPLGNCTYRVRRGRQDEDDGRCWWCQSQHWIRPHLGYYLAWAILWLFPYCWGAFP